MKMTRLVVAGLALASLGLSVGAGAQGRPGPRPGAAADRAAGDWRDAPPPRPADLGFDDRRGDGRGIDRRGLGDRGYDDRRYDDRRFDDHRFDGRRLDGPRPGDHRFDDRGFGGRRFDGRAPGGRFDRGPRWGRDGRGWGRGDDRCWIEHRHGGRVTVCR